MAQVRYADIDEVRKALMGKQARIVDDVQTVQEPAPDAVEAVFLKLRPIATANGWEPQYTYNARGPDDGLHIILVREVVLYCYLLETGVTLSATQRRWQAKLRQAGQETHVWTPEDFPAIQARLTAARKDPLPTL